MLAWTIYISFLGALLLLLLLIKFLAHIGSFGWGFFVDVILAAVVTASPRTESAWCCCCSQALSP